MGDDVPAGALSSAVDGARRFSLGRQGIDYVGALIEFGEKISHVHAKDTEILPAERHRHVINGRWFRFRIPG